MAGPRESLFSTIKCSFCNADVEISQMGDHVCMSAIEESKSSNFPLLKPKSTPQPQKPLGHITIDPSAANRPFRDQLTPTSSSAGSQAHSPATPQDGQPLRTPMHNGPLLPNSQAGNSVYRFGENSTSSSNYSINSPHSHLRSAGVSPVSPPSPPGASGVYPHSHFFAPVSPLPGGGKSVAARINNITPGPFGISSSGLGREKVPEILPANSLDKSPTESADGDAQTLSITADGSQFQPKRSPTGRNVSMDSRSMGMNWEGSGREQSSDPPGLPVPTLVYSPMRRNGDDSPLDPVSPYTHRVMKFEAAPSVPRLDALRLDTRSQTIHVGQSPKPPGDRQAPHPGLGLPGSPSQPVKRDLHRRSKSLFNSQPVPPPEVGLPALPTNRKLGRRRPSVPANKLSGDTPSSSGGERKPAAKLPPPRQLSSPRGDEHTHCSLGNPYDVGPPASHVPSPSMSSNASSVFSNNTKSSRSSLSSPPIPDTRPGPRLPSSTSVEGNKGVSRDSNRLSDIDGLMKELHDSLYDNPAQPKPLVDEGPGEQNIFPPSQDRQAPNTTYPQHPQPQPPQNPKLSYNPQAAPAKPQNPPKRKGRPSKGNCRGCGGSITGKSVSSADGRLTGRYHKSCFVCQACRQPFQSTEFYVLDNLPYCHRHYHKLNNSLCPSCDRGIEGRCLETERHERFHPNCFRCFDCHCELGDDYFDVNGRPYCERHTYRNMQVVRNNALLGLNWGQAKVERRSTRLMFM